MWIYFASLTKPNIDVGGSLYDHLHGHLTPLCSQCFCVLCVILYADSQVSDVHNNPNQKQNSKLPVLLWGCREFCWSQSQLSQSLAACSTRWATTPTNSTCMLHPTCSGGYGCGGGWYRLTLLTGLFPATVAIFTSAHSVMSGITFWLILHVRCKKERQKQTKNYH